MDAVVRQIDRPAESIPRGPESRLGYRPELDGLRGIAILLVMAFHLGGWPRGGELGVDLFFVLSGFLITTLLLEEWDARGSVSLRQFYLRRYFRLFPALAVFIAFFVITVILFANDAVQMRLTGAVFGLTYTSNWVMAFNLPYPEWEIPHLWTLGIEEQFYLLWPPVLVVFLRRRWGARQTMWLLFGIIVAVLAWRSYLYLQGADLSRLKFATDTRIDQLLVGCLAASVFAIRAREGTSRSPVLMAAGVVAGLFVVWQVAVFDLRSAWTLTLGQTVFAAAAALLVYACVRGTMPVLTRALSARALVFIGTISYSLYLWHFSAKGFVERLLGVGSWQAIALEVTFAFIAAVGSYYVVERRFLRHRREHGRLSHTKTDVEASGTPAPLDVRPAA